MIHVNGFKFLNVLQKTCELIGIEGKNHGTPNSFQMKHCSPISEYSIQAFCVLFLEVRGGVTTLQK